MRGIYLIFDYFKQAFHLNREHKGLYKPQIILIVIQTFMILGSGVSLYAWVGGHQLNRWLHGGGVPNEFFSLAWTLVAGIIAIVFIYVVVSRIVEAGLFNMYKQCIIDGAIGAADFWEGVRKYFFKFLLADILLVIAWIPFLIFYLMIGIFTLSIGFAVVPMIIKVFLTMWKISMVMNDSGIFTALSDSLNFAKKHFVPLSVLQLIHWAFANAVDSGGGGRSVNISNIDNIIPPSTGHTSFSEPKIDLESIINITKIVIAVIVPVITIAAAVAALVKMIFEVFFSLALFVAYTNGFEPKEPFDEGGVLA